VTDINLWDFNRLKTKTASKRIPAQNEPHNLPKLNTADSLRRTQEEKELKKEEKKPPSSLTQPSSSATDINYNKQTKAPPNTYAQILHLLRAARRKVLGVEVRTMPQEVFEEVSTLTDKITTALVKIRDDERRRNLNGFLVEPRWTFELRDAILRIERKQEWSAKKDEFIAFCRERFDEIMSELSLSETEHQKTHNETPQASAKSSALEQVTEDISQRRPDFSLSGSFDRFSREAASGTVPPPNVLELCGADFVSHSDGLGTRTRHQENRKENRKESRKENQLRLIA
jgi:hypothetical protein